MPSVALPVRPLLRAFLSHAHSPPTRRADAIQSARSDWLNAAFLDTAGDDELRDRLVAFYGAVVDPPLHGATLGLRSRRVRHGLNHIVSGGDPLPMKFERCVHVDGAYAIGGLGVTFWAAVAQATDPDCVPGWTPTTKRGLQRLGLLKQSDRPAVVLGRMAEAYEHIRCIEPGLSALRVDDFLEQVAAMRGRELAGPRPMGDVIADLVRQVRNKYPLRERLKAHRPVHQSSRDRLDAALHADDVHGVRDALRSLGPANKSMHDEALVEWVGRLWRANDPYPALADYWQSATLLGGGPWLPAAVLHLKAPRRFPLWDGDARRGLAALDDGYDPATSPAESYHLFAEACDELRRRFHLHPIEVPDLLAAAAREPDELPRPDRFDGFCTDTFRFLSELKEHNDRAWMDAERDRYQFAVREPMAELCRALAARYVEPVLNRQLGWDLETDAKVGRALSSVVRNDHGRSVPYESD